jgi:hypothetical protein
LAYELISQFKLASSCCVVNGEEVTTKESRLPMEKIDSRRRASESGALGESSAKWAHSLSLGDVATTDRRHGSNTTTNGGYSPTGFLLGKILNYFCPKRMISLDKREKQPMMWRKVA